MKKKIVLLITVGMVLTGCGASDAALGRTDGSADGTTNASETGMETASNSTGDENVSGEINTEDKDGFVPTPEEKQYTWLEYTVTLPDDWVGRCVMEEHESGFSIYQKASYEINDAAGFICGFFRTDEPMEYSGGEEIIAYTEDGLLYYMVEPLDVPCATDDEELVGEYLRMSQQVPQVKLSMQIAAAGVHLNADEYFFPISSIFPLDPTTLEGFSGYSLWIARNEIYARHGRQFTNEYLQQYFNRCTWYHGEIPPQEFDENVLNQIEKDNVQLLMATEKEYARQHPYPKMYQASQTASVDLNGDGKVDKISYRVAEEEDGSILCMLTVNGDTYTANTISDYMTDMRMTNPMTDCFYITDILESDNILEIAVLDEGPSEDPVTYFFQYSNTLSCIGYVPGFPFADMNGGINGFDGYGGINGYSQADLIETSFLQEHRWYNGSDSIMEMSPWHDFLPSHGHILYEDLPIYCTPDETSVTTVIPAGEEIFFLSTDKERWILVKGKNGCYGYILVEDGNIVLLNKPAEEVISGLQFSG